ncbi:MAG: histidine kinase, partial [Oscillospiraceae bacterium]
MIGVVLLVHYRKLLRRHELLELLVYCTLPVAALLLKLVWDASQIYLAMTLSLVLIHSVMYREHRRRLQEQERKLEQSRIAVLLGQIQPHFLYNVLNSIYYLCASDPLAAQGAISDFSDYLRTNLDALKQESPIGFDEELRHVRTYLALEKTRYDEMLTVSFDIRCESFRMPALCLQMLVENAV